MDELKKKLSSAVSKKRLAFVERRNITAENSHGFVLQVSDDLVLFQQASDFLIDGYAVIRLEDITSLRSGIYERFFEKMYRGEGVMAQIGELPAVDLSDWKSLLKSLKKIGQNVIIECENLDDGLFYIGKLVRVNQRSVEILHFDALGKWEEEPSTVRYDEITQVRFDEQYIKIFSKYLS
ncbi:MAG: hypothetical protein ACKVZH_17720 [Blastocatellia bacterium]